MTICHKITDKTSIHAGLLNTDIIKPVYSIAKKKESVYYLIATSDK